jgi:hypothetical protein
VAGWRPAELEGRIAGHAIATAAGRTTAPTTANSPTTTNSLTTAGRAAVGAGAGSDGVPAVLLRRRERGRGFGVALQEAYPVKAGWRTWLRDDTLVCRCEEVPLARVREAQELGATDARAVKLLARPGMGWCQGRICGYAVSCLAGEPPQPPRRPIAQPVTLGALAELTTDPDERPAH